MPWGSDGSGHVTLPGIDGSPGVTRRPGCRWHSGRGTLPGSGRSRMRSLAHASPPVMEAISVRRRDGFSSAATAARDVRRPDAARIASPRMTAK